MAGDAGIKDVSDRLHGMATDMAATHKSAEGLGSVFKQVAVGVGAYETLKHIFIELVKRSETYSAFERAISKENLSRVGIMGQHVKLLKEKRQIEQDIRHTTGDLRDYNKALLSGLNAQLEVLGKQKNLAIEVQKVGNTTLGVFGVYKLAAIDLYLKQRQFNQNLIEANSTFEHRNQLMKDTLMLQTRSGIAFDKVTEAARALVRYNMDSETTFEANLELVSKLHQGLGVSVDESARLASIVERQVKGSFEGVARTIAQIVEDTALAGDEAARLAMNIGTALGRLRPGLGAAGLPEVVRLVGRYEGALKEIGGQPGAFQDLINNLTSTRGITGMGALQITPESLVKATGIKTAMDRFASFGNMIVGNKQGAGRFQALEQLGEIFSVSADQANQMLMAIKRANEQQMGQISLQERWKQQLNATNSGIARITSSLWGLLQTGLLPVVNLVGMLTNKLADLVEWLLQSKTTVTVIGYALLGVGVLLTASLWGVVRAMWAVVFGSRAAQAALARFAAVQAATAATGGVGRGIGAALSSLSWGNMIASTGASLTAFKASSIASRGLWNKVGTLFPTFSTGFFSIAGLLGRVVSVLRILTGPVGIVTGVVIGIGIYAAKQYSEIKRLREENAKATQIILDRQEALKARKEAFIYNMARYEGTPEDMLKQYRSITEIIRQQATSPEELESQLAEAAKSFTEGMDMAVTSKVMFKPLSERTPAEEKRETELLSLGEKTLRVNEDAKKLFIQRTRMAQESAQEDAVERAKSRYFWLWGRYNPLRIGSVYASDAMQPD